MASWGRDSKASSHTHIENLSLRLSGASEREEEDRLITIMLVITVITHAGLDDPSSSSFFSSSAPPPLLLPPLQVDLCLRSSAKKAGLGGRCCPCGRACRVERPEVRRGKVKTALSGAHSC